MSLYCRSFVTELEAFGQILNDQSLWRRMVMTAINNKELRDRVVLVTGASRNIGRAIACALAEAGADVVVHAAQDQQAASETVRLVEQAGTKALLVMGDLSDPATAPRIIKETITRFGRLDMLINNAAVRPETSFAEMTYADWRQVMSVCLDAAFLTTHAALDYLQQSDQACIINIGGLTGHTGAANRVHVIAAKSGIVGFTKALAHELSAQGITVNCISPGLIDTLRADGTSPHHHASIKNLVGRRGQPQEVAAMVVYLCSLPARYITGQTIHVNGGAYLP